jgi:hypothetical protein
VRRWTGRLYVGRQCRRVRSQVRAHHFSFLAAERHGRCSDKFLPTTKARNQRSVASRFTDARSTDARSTDAPSTDAPSTDAPSTERTVHRRTVYRLPSTEADSSPRH